MTAREILRDALNGIGVIAINETVPAYDAVIAQRALNMLLDQWSIEDLMVFYRSNETFTLTASTGTYYIGPDDNVITDSAETYTAGNISAVVNGTTVTTAYTTNKDITLTAFAAAIYNARSDVITSATYSAAAHTITIVAKGIEKLTITVSVAAITGTMTVTVAAENPTTILNTTRPIGIESAFVRVSGYDYPLEIITNSKYQEVTDKSEGNTWPNKLHYIPSYPLGVIRLLPIPDSAYTLGLTQSYQLIKTFTLDDEITLPPGYNAALVKNLEVELYPLYGKEVRSDVFAQAKEAKANIKRRNQEFPLMKNDFIGTRTGNSYNINTDRYE